MPPDLTVVLCSLNGAGRIATTLAALREQTVADRIEVLVVDDGSTDGTGGVAAEWGVRVLRREVNGGLSAARNTGTAQAHAPIVAFIDDDCRPAPGWAEALLSGHGPGVIGVSGPVVPVGAQTFLAGFVVRSNRHQPLELNLAAGQGLLYRLGLYLRRQWLPLPDGRRDIYCPTGGNMSFTRAALTAVGGFDPDFRFGSEEEDMVRRMRRDHPGRIVFLPEAPVEHRLEPDLRALLRRSVAYGRGNARQYRKWPSVNPTLFPWPFLVAATAAAAVLWPPALLVAAVLPLVLYPDGLHNLTRHRVLAALADPYLRLLQEAFENIGFIRGAIAHRGIAGESEAVR
ncbi:glycosyltransferase [Actinocorallia longicatena]|uniref:Glycosyltransferase 2-like domain-containing protein n=1 Tax=Actinocorallia longicatena TaxID=111803 RepID=A0ABP6QH63_9ACTN